MRGLRNCVSKNRSKHNSINDHKGRGWRGEMAQLPHSVVGDDLWPTRPTLALFWAAMVNQTNIGTVLGSCEECWKTMQSTYTPTWLLSSAETKIAVILRGPVLETLLQHSWQRTVSWQLLRSPTRRWQVFCKIRKSNNCSAKPRSEPCLGSVCALISRPDRE